MAFNLFVNTVDTKGKLQSSVAPTNANDLATKAYVDSSAGSGDWIDSVLKQENTAESVPAANARYLVGPSPTVNTAWVGKANQIAVYNGGGTPGTTTASWDYTVPTEGTHVFVEGGSSNADTQLVYNGATWVVGGSLSGALVASQNLSDVASAPTARTNLGITLDVGNAQLAVADGGTGASAAAGARTNLGVAIGSDVQAHDAQLDEIAALTPTNGGIIVGDGSAFVLETAGTARTSLGAAASGPNTDITSLGGLTSALSVAQGGTGAVTAAAAFDGLSPTTTSGDIIYSDGTNNVRLAKGTDGQVLTLSSGLPSWAAASGGVTSVGFKDDDGDIYAITASGNLEIAGAAGSEITSDVNTTTGVMSLDMNMATAGTSALSVKGRAGFDQDHFDVTTGFVTIKAASIDLAADVTGSLPIANGGTGAATAAAAFDALSPTTTRGDLVYNNGTNNARLAIGSDGQFLKASFSGGNTDPVWASIGTSDLSSAIATGGGQGDKLVQTSSGSAPAAGDVLTLDSNGRLIASTDGVVPSVNVSEPASGAGTTLSMSFGPAGSAAQLAKIQVLNPDANATTSTLTLPQASAAHIGKSFLFKTLDNMSSSNKLVIQRGGSDVIDGPTTTSVDLDQDFQAVRCTLISFASGVGTWILS